MKTSDLHLVDRLRPGEFLLQVAHTAEIDAATPAQARDLLDVVFEGEMTTHALGATDEAVSLYEHRGWIQWQGPTSALTPAGVVRTPDEDGGVYVLPLGTSMDIAGDLTCDWRDGDVW